MFALSTLSLRTILSYEKVLLPKWTMSKISQVAIFRNSEEMWRCIGDKPEDCKCLAAPYDERNAFRPVLSTRYEKEDQQNYWNFVTLLFELKRAQCAEENNKIRSLVRSVDSMAVK